MANFAVRFVSYALLLIIVSAGATAHASDVPAQGSQKREGLPWKQSEPAQDPYAPSTQGTGNHNSNDAYDEQKGDNQQSGNVPSSYQPRPYSPSAPANQPSAHSGPDDTTDQRRHNKPPQKHGQQVNGGEEDDEYYSEAEIIEAGHVFFGKLSEGLAKAVETVFRRQGRPTGYILGQDAGGAFVAGLRYGEGYLHTKYGERRKIFWQGPSLGYDFGGEGSRTMVLVYNLRHPGEIYRRFGGVQGSAYVIGGASVQLLKNGDITLAPIRTGVGLRVGANIGYLKYTPRPTWNPF